MISWQLGTYVYNHDVLSTSANARKIEEDLMRKLTMILTAAALMLGTLAIAANAQTQAPGAASLHAQIHNFTPIIKQAACNGTWGAYGCGPGWVRRCGYWGCRCMPCY
jgi:hypothetical protein